MIIDVYIQYVRARKEIDEQVYSVPRFSTTTFGDGDMMKWIENTIRTGVTGAKKRSRKDKREVLREERKEGRKKTYQQIADG